MDYPTYEGLISRLGITVTQSPAERVGIDAGRRKHPAVWLLHGGASAALAETVGSLAAMAHAGQGQIAVGVDLNITHHRR